jgi:hypothetical protein
MWQKFPKGEVNIKKAKLQFLCTKRRIKVQNWYKIHGLGLLAAPSGSRISLPVFVRSILVSVGGPRKIQTTNSMGCFLAASAQTPEAFCPQYLCKTLTKYMHLLYNYDINYHNRKGNNKNANTILLPRQSR